MIVAYVGDVGSGKTLNMAWDVMRACYHGRHVISNTPIDGFLDPLFKPKRRCRVEFIPNGDKFKHALAYRENCVFALDEAAVYLPNYFWNKLPEEFIVKFAQNRKYNTDIWYTTQGFGMAVSRLRELTQIIYHCYPKKILFQKCYVAERFSPKYFKGEQTLKKRERYFRGSRILYPSQQRRIFKAYNTYYVVDSSATMRVKGFTQPTWDKNQPGHSVKTLTPAPTPPETTKTEPQSRPEIPIKSPETKKLTDDTSQKKTTIVQTKPVDLSTKDPQKNSTMFRNLPVTWSTEPDDGINYPHEVIAENPETQEKINSLLQSEKNSEINTESLPGSENLDPDVPRPL